jgi:hypothetical protein
LSRFPAFEETPVAAVSGSIVGDAVSSIVVGATAGNEEAGSALACRGEARLRRVLVTNWPAVVEVATSVDTFD